MFILLTGAILAELQTSLAFLKYFDTPWEDVTNHWKKTVSYRRNSRSRNVSEFLAEWPILRNNNSSSLVTSVALKSIYMIYIIYISDKSRL